MLTLFRWQLRQLFVLNLAVILAVIWWAIFDSSPLTFVRNPLPALFAIGHGALMAILLGRGNPRRSGFLYAQGFSRDRIWLATALATLTSAALISAAVWLCIVLKLRSHVQEWCGNPWFPLVGASEAGEAVTFFLLYALVLSIAHYVWVRARLPQPDFGAGWIVAVLLMLAAGLSRDMLRRSPSSSVTLTCCWTLLAAVLLIGSWRLHRKTEVQA